MAMNAQKFIGRNRAPRVQIEYDVDIGDAKKSVELPWVMGVMADLSGKGADGLEPVSSRKFLEIDSGNFDARLKASKPKVQFRVPDKLSGKEDQELSVEITFESLDDFSPAAVARKVEPLRKLLETRTQLSNLLSHIDGKEKAEDQLAEALGDEALLKQLMSMKAADGDDDADEKEAD